MEDMHGQRILEKRSEAKSDKSSGATMVFVELEGINRQRSQLMLTAVLEMEIDEFLQRVRYARGHTLRGRSDGESDGGIKGVGWRRCLQLFPQLLTISLFEPRLS